MKLSYDPEVDALYIRLTDKRVQVTTHRLSEEVAVNMGPDGQVIGIEVLDASSTIFGDGPARTIQLENLTALPS